MSPRPYRLRKVNSPPLISGFKPYGSKQKNGTTESVFLHLEEYEALRLCDYEMLNHHQAAILMNVSRPTLTRVYSRARHKIGEAFVQGKQIIIEGGKIYFDSEWYLCDSCGCYFNNPEKQKEVIVCPLCRSSHFRSYQPVKDNEKIKIPRCSDLCICPSCGFEMQQSSGYPFKEELCPKCGNSMIRHGMPYFNSI
jgi:predicted DNA-binding protein (UPF0251 family)